MSDGLSRVEAQANRAELKLRYNTEIGFWQVYTILHGSKRGLHWYTINHATKIWYETSFPGIPVVPFNPQEN